MNLLKPMKHKLLNYSLTSCTVIVHVSVRASASEAGGRGFDPVARHNKDVKNGTSHHFCIIGWFPAYKKSILEKQVTRPPLNFEVTFEVRGVLVTCISNIDFFKAGNQRIMQKW